MSDFEEVYDHPDKPGEYLTKAELDEYNAKKELGAGIQKIAEDSSPYLDLISDYCLISKKRVGGGQQSKTADPLRICNFSLT